MARNANWDKAKRQAVGIYRAASPQASINKGVAEYSGGDYRVPEGAKSCYHPADTSAADQAAITAYLTHNGTVTRCGAFLNSSGRTVRPNDLNRKRGNADMSLDLRPATGYGRPRAKW